MILAFHGTSLWAAQDIFTFGVSNILESRGIRHEVICAVDILKKISNCENVKDALLNCAYKSKVPINEYFLDAICGVISNDQNRFLSYGSFYADFRLDIAISYANNGPEIARHLNKLMDIFSFIASEGLIFDDVLKNINDFISKPIEPVVLVFQLLDDAIEGDNGNISCSASEYYKSISEGGNILGQSSFRVSKLDPKKIVGYYDLSLAAGIYESILPNCNGSLVTSQWLYKKLSFAMRMPRHLSLGHIDL